jgi:hypothetical protein
MVKTIDDYIPFLEQEFPDIPAMTLRRIVHDGIVSIQNLIYKDHDVRVWNGTESREYHLGVVKSITTDDVRQKRALKNRKRLDKLRMSNKQK